MQGNYIKISRSVFDHWIFEDAEYFKAWIYMVGRVNWKDKETRLGNKIIECKRGQTAISIGTWQRELMWSRQRVRTFFNLLEKDGMIKTENLGKTTMLTICKYDDYQGVQPVSNQIATSQQPDSNQSATTTKEGKKERSISISKDIHVCVELLNRLAGRKYSSDSKATIDLLRARLKDFKVEDICAVINMKVNEWKDNDKMQKFLQPSTLFRKSNFEKYFEQLEQSKIQEEDDADVFLTLEQDKELEIMNSTIQKELRHLKSLRPISRQEYRWLLDRRHLPGFPFMSHDTFKDEVWKSLIEGNGDGYAKRSSTDTYNLLLKKLKDRNEKRSRTA